jgi:2-hydroxychromene-2-carboxylate isomerase
MAIEFWFEFASTYSYPAAMRIEEAAASAGKRLVLKPFLLGPIFKSQGWPDSPFNIYPVKGRYMWRDLERICEGLRIPFQKPSHFPRNGLLAARVVAGSDGAAWLPAFIRNVYTASFARDLDIASADVLRDCLREAGADPEVALPAAAADAAKARLRENTDRATALGIFGAPSFVVEGELFWGNDRLDAALAWRPAPCVANPHG